MPAFACCGSSADVIESDIVHPGVVVHPPVREPEKITVNLYFRHLAWAYAASFFGTLFISGIVTFTGTPYTPETDKITLFYGMFNPCIWFDHYPAKVFATTGMGVFLLIGVAYSAMIFVYVYVEKKMLKVMWSGSLICLVVLIDLVFVNVFTTNLYPKEDDEFHELQAAGGIRRLHGVHFGANNTISLLEENELSQADINVIKLHTAFYILWVVGQVIFSLKMFKIAWERSFHWTAQDKVWVIILNIVGWYGMMMHAGAMLIIIMHPEPKVNWYFQTDLTSRVQHILIWFDAKTFTSAWGWVPIMAFRLIMPSGSGISLTFRLEKVEGDHGSVMPEHWMNRCMWAMALVLCWGGIFDTEWTGYTHAAEKLMVALRLKPYAYFGGPAFLACIIVLFVGLALQVVQKTLLNANRIPGPFLAHAGFLFVLMFSLVLVVLEKATWIWYVFLLAQVVFVAWVWHMNLEEIAAGRWMHAVSYTVLGVGIMLASVFTVQWWMYFAYLGWMAIYGLFVPDGPAVYITAGRIEEALTPYKEVPHNMVSVP